MTVMRKIDLTDITPEELAELFTDMFDDQQAAFFAAIKPISDKWPGAGLCMQSCNINQRLNDDGRFVLETLASHLPGEVLLRLYQATGDDQ